MAEPINMEDAELVDLMAALEAETGVSAATATAPVVATSTAPVVAPEAATAASSPLPDDELLAALEEAPTASEASLPAALVAGIKAQQAAAVTTDPVVEATTAASTAVADVNVDDELAALEAGLADEPTGAVHSTGHVDHSPETRVSPQPPAEETKASVVSEVTARAEADAKVDASVQLQSQLSTLDFFVDPKQFNVDTRVSDVDLDKCMMEQNALRAFYGVQAAQAEAQYGRTKMKFEIIEAKLYDQHRRLLTESGEKVTEKMVENEVKKDPRWSVAKGKVIDAEAIFNINRALVESLRDRSSMLVNLSADRRDEMKQTRSTNAITSAHEEQRARAAEAAKSALAG